MKFTFSRTVALVALLVSSFSLYSAWQANQIALEAKNVNLEGVNFSKDVRSQQISEAVYNDIYDNEQNRASMLAIKANKQISNPDSVLKLVDNLEKAGLSFCQGTAWVKHLKMYLKNTLSVICDNDQVYSLYAIKKNGLALLCTEFFPDSKFAKMLDKKNINSCSFIDSAMFQNSTSR